MIYRKLYGWKYELLGSCTFPIPEIKIDVVAINNYLTLTDGILHIKSHYAWDGASGPAIDTKNFMRGSVVHDALYQLMRQGLLDKKYRKAADMALRRICIKNGMGKLRAAWVYMAVRTFGGFTLKNKRPKNEGIEA